RLKAKDGSIRHVRITSNARFKDGELICTRCFTYDVTEAVEAEERAREGELKFRALVDDLPAAIYTTDADGKITYYNDAAATLAGRRPRIGQDQWCITWRLFHPDGQPMTHDECPMAIALKEQRPVRGQEAIAERPDGSRVRFVPYPTPLFDGSGKLSGAINMLVDITDLRRIEAEAAHLAAVVESSNDAIVSKTLDGRVRSWNEGARQIFGYAVEQMVGQPITKIIPPELHSEAAEIRARLRSGEQIRSYETIRLTKDGRRINVSLTISPVRDRSGRIIGISKVARDITERKASEELQRRLFDELNHRVKNTLAIIQSIANRSLRDVRPREAVADFEGRLRALAQAHDLLVLGKMKGAVLEDIVREQVLLDALADDRISIHGPDVELDPRMAVQLALVLHELATNARKYGALSQSGGSLSIQWSVQVGDQQRLRLSWTESGLRNIRVPARKGFGTTMIEHSFSGGGEHSSLEFHSDGVRCEIELPLSGRPAASSAASLRNRNEEMASDTRPAGIVGASILIIEDEPLIALDLQDGLETAGMRVVGIATNVEEAEELIETATCDATLLDGNLHGQPVDRLAALLLRKKIPFIFSTGYGRESLPRGFEQAPVLTKPFSVDKLLKVLGELLRPEQDPTVVPFPRSRN
ncbi:PAS domain S-box protein, partial [Geminicoccus flavidas]|uniref:PAS domain S-box protein n=1 Tax=Geminicoccus flavidas TaxID=2506407 RepID=UPI001356D9EC